MSDDLTVVEEGALGARLETTTPDAAATEVSRRSSVAPQPPSLRILTPGATDEEVAALVAVVSAMAGAGEGGPKPPTPEWSAHQRKLRPSYRPGPGGWRSSGMP